MNTPQNVTMWWSKQLMRFMKNLIRPIDIICSVFHLDDIRPCVERPLYCDALGQLGFGRWMWHSMQAIVFVEKVFLVSIPPADQKQKICDCSTSGDALNWAI
jgi:hypothetical protein